ncbi:MAG TPA: hypothetical protein VFW24_15815 [Acidimicrobiales bacterium]|nr:hypothetical protein [Acidimicrobiales bacterium]
MTSYQSNEASIRADLRHRATVSAGVGLLTFSAILTWVVAGTWVALGLLGLLAGAALAWSAGRTSRLESRREADIAEPTAERIPAGLAVGPGQIDPGDEVDRHDVLERALRHDLPLMVNLCQGLASGGLPQAGLLAEHTYVVSDAVRRLLAEDDLGHPAGSGAGFEALAAERAAVAAQLCEVAGRAERLYTADRPGGLDHLDWHLARLWVVLDDYLAVRRDREDNEDGRARDASGINRECPAMPSRRRARLLAWSAVASGAELSALRAGEPAMTRTWLRLGMDRRARKRAVRLFGRAATEHRSTRTPAGRRAPASSGREVA